MKLTAGTWITPQIKLVEPLGRGAMGYLWVADHQARPKQVAVKIISSSVARDNPESLARFKREAKAIARITSRHVAQVYEYDATEDGTPYIVMELLDGENLGQRLERVGKLSLEHTARVVDHIARALSEAHEHSIIHRDIKPDNIFLVGPEEDPTAKLLDFGTVKQMKLRTDSLITRTGVMVGTPDYMSPEQVLGSKDIDQRADLWSLGVVAYHTITGRLPFQGKNAHALALAICDSSFTPASSHEPGLPASLDPWFERALAQRPEGRFDTATDMAEAFTDATSGAAPFIADDQTLDIHTDQANGPAPTAGDRHTLDMLDRAQGSPEIADEHTAPTESTAAARAHAATQHAAPAGTPSEPTAPARPPQPSAPEASAPRGPLPSTPEAEPLYSEPPAPRPAGTTTPATPPPPSAVRLLGVLLAVAVVAIVVLAALLLTR